GSFVAVDDITLHVPRGVLYGFLGPNGAGKTTTLRMIAGILRPSQGRVLLGGDDVHQSPLAAKLRLGFIPDRPFVYDKLTGAEFLRFVAGLYGQEGDVVERRIGELLEGVGRAGWQGGVAEGHGRGPATATPGGGRELGGAVPQAHRRRRGARAGRGAGSVKQPSLRHVLQPKWRTALQRVREERARGGSGKLLILGVVGLAFWIGVYGVLYRILKYFRGVEDLGPLLAGKLLGLVLLSFISILVLSNVIT